ncbi:hypothetical protein DB347_07430 [Opitutaceae bacterium EW11]|nr:hypothetical protein DB347_07430 [Opitutaceae bacterium EW11]
MSSNPFTSEATPAVDRAAILAANPGIKSAAHWFWWIVGLSVINTVLVHSGSHTSFAVGLGFTLLADLFFRELMAVALVFDVAVVGFFVVMGVFAVRGHRWAFLIGGIVYAADALIFLYFQDYLALALHGWALFSLTTGGLALHRAIKQARSATGVSAEPPEPAAAVVVPSAEPATTEKDASGNRQD